MPLSDYFPELEGWKPVETVLDKPNSSPAVPDPNNTVNPFLRTAQPLLLQYQQDTMRQSNRPGLSSYRNAPLAPNAQSSTQASVASTSAIVAKAVAKTNGIVTVGLTMPSQYTIASSPLSPPGGTIGVQWNPVSPGQVLQGPPPGFSGFEGATSAQFPSFIGPQKVTNISFTPTSQTSLLLYAEQGSQGGTSLASQGWTSFGVSNLFSKSVTGFTPQSVSRTQSQQNGYCSFIAAFTGTPAIVQSATNNVLVGSTTLNVTAGDTMLVCFFTQASSPGVSTTVAVSDSQGNTYQLITSAAVSGTNSGAAPSGVFQGISLYAAVGVQGGSLTISWIISYAGNVAPSLGTPIIELVELGPLPTGPGLPSFGPLNPASIPTINAASLAGILPTKSGGSGANLSATGGPGQVVFESTVGGPFTVGPYLAVSSKSASFAAAYQNLYLISTASGQVNVTLPTAASASGAVMAFKKTSSDANFVNLIALSPQQVEGGTAAQFNQQFTTLTIASDGTNWWII